MYINRIIKSPIQNFKERRFVLIRCLGQGIQGEVYEAKVENQTFYQTNVAIKLYKDINEREKQFIERILQWQKENQDNQNSFLVKIYERIQDNNQICVIMELGQYSLKDYLDNNNNLFYDEKKLICLSISKSVQFLHNHYYFHRDIKPENFVQINNQFKLTDFGLIKEIQEIQTDFRLIKVIQEIQTTPERLQTQVGSYQYMAPEIKDLNYSNKIDIWALGCIFYEIFRGEQLFQGKNIKQVQAQKQEFNKLTEDNIQRNNIKQIQVPQWSDLILKMLNPIEEKRLDIIQVVAEIEKIQIMTLKAPTKQNPQREFILQYKASRFYDANEINNQTKYTIAIYDINTINEQIIDWLISKQDNNSINPPLHTIIYEKYIIDNKIYLIMEQEQMSLQTQQNSDLSQEEIVTKYFLDIYKSIQYFHQNDYCFTDIQQNNIQTDIHLDMYLKINNRWKFADFQSIKRYQPSFQDDLIFDAKSVDIFRLGCLFYEFLEGKIIFEIRTLKANPKLQINADINNYLNNKNKIINKINNIQSKSCQQLISAMLKSIEESSSSLILDQVIQSIENQFPQQNNYPYYVNSILEAPNKEFPKRQFKITKLLGEGGEGGVFQATPQNETFYNTDIALKISQKMKDGELLFIDFLIDYQKNKEQQTFLKSNLIKVYERFEYQDKHILIMELGGKDLLYFLQKKLQIQQKESICQQIAQSIAFLHKHQLIHRDIKPENFIQIGTIFKLIDFGLIKKRELNLRLTRMVGSPFYQAPEIIKGSEDYQASVDIWSLGCLFFEIFEEKTLFNGKTTSEIQFQILKYCQNQQQVHQLIDQLSINYGLKNLIKQMIHPIPEYRPNIDQVQKEFLPKFFPKFFPQMIKGKIGNN